MGAKIQAFDIFQTPLSSHYPLHLKTPHRLSPTYRKVQLGPGKQWEKTWFGLEK
jgi:hypothetical protein